MCGSAAGTARAVGTVLLQLLLLLLLFSLNSQLEQAGPAVGAGNHPPLEGQ